MSQNPLADLRDIHLPAPISSWPLAPGWYILAGILIIGFISAGIFFVYHYRKYRIKRHALKLIKQWRAQMSPDNAAELTTNIAELIKRIAVIFFPEQKPAHLHGEIWLEFLNKTGRTQAFSQAPGNRFAHAHYQEQPPENLDDYCQCAIDWIKRIK